MNAFFTRWMCRPSGAALALTTLMMAATAGQVDAAGSAVIVDDDGRRFAVEYLDDRLRIQPQRSDEGTMIVRDGKVYLITGQTVIDMGAMMRGLGVNADFAPSTGPEDVARVIALRDAGRNETVAGISGRVHVLEYEDEDGDRRSEELVLSEDARARALGLALKRMADTIGSLVGGGGIDDAGVFAAFGNRGVLRYGQDFRVVELSASRPAASRFDLPAEPQSMPNLGAVQQAPTRSQGDGGVGAALGGLLGGRAERQQQRVEDRTGQEVDEATDRAVDKVLDRAFGRIFGN